LFELTYENARPWVHKLRTAAYAASYSEGCEDRVFGDAPLCPDCGEDEFHDHPQYRCLFPMTSLSDAAPLRNIVHDGALDDLREVIDLYSERDIHPERWYPRARDGRMLRLDGLPKQYHSNIDIVAPLDRRPGSAPTLTRFEIDDVIAFPITLTDAYTIAR
jgi:cytochrome c peroxidase